jgi:hypothetical protein
MEAQSSTGLPTVKTASLRGDILLSLDILIFWGGFSVQSSVRIEETLSKRSGRRVGIAIHERSLYEYLALELSPTFAEDKLITVELVCSVSHETCQDDSSHLTGR